LAAELIAVDSVNPTLAATGGGEAAAANVLANWLERAGLEVTVDEVAPGRPNVVAVARGSGGGRTLLLNGHLDTVGLLEPDGGLDARVEGGRLYGRGSYDMKASLAAIASCEAM
jgi:acetylornithine deacetylase